MAIASQGSLDDGMRGSSREAMEFCWLPSLLYNAGSSVDISREKERQVEALQTWYLHLLLRQDPGVPAGSMLWETGMLSVALLIYREKLCLALHICSLGEDTLARRRAKGNSWQLRHRAGNCSLNRAQSERSFKDNFTNNFSYVTLVNKDGR